MEKFSTSLYMAAYFAVVCALNGVAEDPTLVRTTHGFVRGLRLTIPTGRVVDHYLGIPYAKSPVGNLRFKHPVSTDPWPAIYNATQAPNSCEQRPLPGVRLFKPFTPYRIDTPLREDCLKLNVWVPVPRSSNATILIWIFGGGFVTGSCSQAIYNGRILASEENIIVVCFNYRLSSLGFLYLGHPDVPGNAGLYDQLAAIKWMKDNAANFGGDPNKITVFGESAGASTAAFLLFSPLNHNLFNRVIMESGSLKSLWASTSKETILKVSYNIARDVGCPKGNRSIEEVIQCLNEAYPVSLVEAVPYFPDKFDETLRPFPDGKIISYNWEEELKSGNVARNYSILFGNNANDGSLVLFAAIPDRLSLLQEEANLTVQDFKRTIKRYLADYCEVIWDTTEFLYTNWSSPSKNYLSSAEGFSTDYVFTCNSEALAQTIVMSGNKAYSYVFDHRPELKEWPKWLGTTHTVEMEFVFGEPLDPNKGYSGADVNVSKTVMRYWSNFARTGDPNENSDGTVTEPVWPEYREETGDYVTISSQGIIPFKTPQRAPFCRFWNHLFPKISKQCK